MNAAPVALALVICLVASAPVAADAVAAGVASSGLNGPGVPQGGRLALGSLVATSPGACAVAYTLQVQTEVGTGSDAFELQVFDDATLIQVQSLGAPADGAVHELSGTLHIAHSVSQTTPGIGVYLVDSGIILDFVDPLPVTCGAVEIPAIDGPGAWILGGLLLASALLVLRRPRRSL